jgi:hypothetical protein
VTASRLNEGRFPPSLANYSTHLRIHVTLGAWRVPEAGWKRPSFRRTGEEEQRARAVEDSCQVRHLTAGWRGIA